MPESCALSVNWGEDKLALYRTEALILRSRKYLEADSLLTLLTREKGKVPAIAKGARKPQSKLRGGVQPFTQNDMLLSAGRNLDVVTQSQSLEAFTPLQDDIRAMTAAAYWSELLEALTVEGEADTDVFNLALAGFHILCLSPSDLTVRAMEIKLLTLLGYAPCLDRCVVCGRDLSDQQPFFSARQGGVLCPACSQVQSPYPPGVFSQEALLVWQQLAKMDLTKTARIKVTLRGSSILEESIGEVLLEQLERPLKSRAIMKMIMNE